MKCYLCGHEQFKVVRHGVRTDPDSQVLICVHCGLIFLGEYKINYRDNEMLEIDSSDTMDGADTERRFEHYKRWFQNSRILDFGCGKGSLLTKLKTDRLVNSTEVYAFEPNRIFANLLANQFPLYTQLDIVPNRHFNIITLFHVIEHLEDPIEILNTLYDKLLPQGKIIIEVPNHDEALFKLYNCSAYNEFMYTPYHNFYFTTKTLKKLLDKTLFDVEFIRIEQRYELSNHLHWLAKGQPNGHLQWPFLDSIDYKRHIESIGMGDTLTAVVKKC
jgi:SAM-dependent methyltransferase